MAFFLEILCKDSAAYNRSVLCCKVTKNPFNDSFVCFFLLAGNVSRIGVVNEFFSMLLEKNTLLTAIGSCQVISNVPSAILLSEFTTSKIGSPSNITVPSYGSTVFTSKSSYSSP